jgi:hypothetical protein
MARVKCRTLVVMAGVVASLLIVWDRLLQVVWG